MTPSPPPAPEGFAAALVALIAACDAADAYIADAPDAHATYLEATAMYDALKRREASPARSRALAAEQIWREEHLSIGGLAERLGLSKSRAAQLLDSAAGEAPRADTGPPGYQSLAASLRDRIASGDLPAGSLLSVADLMSEHGMTRGVVLRAVAILKDEGLVTTSGGRGGGVRVL